MLKYLRRLYLRIFRPKSFASIEKWKPEGERLFLNYSFRAKIQNGKITKIEEDQTNVRNPL